MSQASTVIGLKPVRLNHSLSGALEPLVIYWFTLFTTSEKGSLMTASARIRLLAVLAGLVLPLSLQAQARAESHTVNRGDTLWDLARTYLGDPLLWPEIYRMNTNVVEDPHWIYPGEVLRLSGGADVSAVPTTDTPPPAGNAAEGVIEANAAPDSLRAGDDQAAPDEAAPDEAVAEAEVQSGALDVGNRVDNRDNIDLSPLVGRKVSQQTGPSLELALARAYRPIRRSEYYSSGFLTEGRQIPFGLLLGTVTPLQIEADNTRNSAQLFTRVAIKPPTGGTYQVGDTLLIVRVMPAFQNYGNIIVPTGLIRVQDVKSEENVGEVIAAYGQITSGNMVMPAEKFVELGNTRPVPISDGLDAKVLTHRDRQPLSGIQDVIFLDKGREAGVALGDLFEIRSLAHKREGAPAVTDEVTATVQVVHLGDRHSSARVIKVIHPKLPINADAKQIAKLPS